MKNSRLTDRHSLVTKLGAAAWKFSGIAVATGVLVVTAPFVDLKEHEEVMPPRAPASSPSESRISVTLRHGDTLISILKRFGIERPSAHALIAKVRPLVNLRKIQPGDNVHVVLNAGDQSVDALEMMVENNLVRVKATSEGGWLAERKEIPFVRDTRVVRGTIKGSLYESGIDAGLSPQQILDLARIFEYDIDFFSDFHPQDGFSVIVEDLHYGDGRRVAGRILGAELEAEKKTFDAFRYVTKDGNADYYNSNGEALRRSFLRAPLSFARISSPFNRNRMHPIFRTVRPHLAIDYAAPAGTPVVAIGKGRVEFAGWRNGYGNVVDIRHSGSYVSRYAHFSRIAARLRKGQSVDAGDVIGYVGQTGHATGPHLHFEFLRGGAKINFLAMRIPKTEQLAGADLQQFNRLRAQRQTLLQGDENRLVNNSRQGL